MKIRSAMPFALFLGLAVSTVARGEVAAVVDVSGSYLYMSMDYPVQGGTASIWSALSTDSYHRILNPSGDARGDLAPTVLSRSNPANGPMVVWPRRTGKDYDLVYAVWTGSAWSQTRWVAPDSPYNDFEPRLAPNSHDQAYMVWWRDENGIGTVYFSVFFGTYWSVPKRVSPTGLDSRHANLVLVNDTVVDITYETSRGIEGSEISVNPTDSITDDIDPKLQIHIR